MDGRCERHQFEAAANRCGHCGEEFCSDCLLYPFGEKKPPFCIPCTIAQSGLRSGGAKPKKAKLSRKERKELAAAGPITSGATPVVSASAQAMMSANKPTVRVAEDPVEAKPAKKGRLGRRKGGEEDAAAPSPVAAAPVAPAPRAAEPEPVADEDRGVPEGAGMTAPGAETIDWSKPFEVSS